MAVDALKPKELATAATTIAAAAATTTTTTAAAIRLGEVPQVAMLRASPDSLVMPVCRQQRLVNAEWSWILGPPDLRFYLS